MKVTGCGVDPVHVKTVWRWLMSILGYLNLSGYGDTVPG
jgi:hypothetical protein